MKPVGELIDELYARRAERLELSRKVDELKAQEHEIRTSIIQQLKSAGLEGGKGASATAAITTEDQAKITDWPAFWQYLQDTKSEDLVQKRVAITAVRARWEHGEEIPGLEKVVIEDLSLTKRR